MLFYDYRNATLNKTTTTTTTTKKKKKKKRQQKTIRTEENKTNQRTDVAVEVLNIVSED